MSDFIGHAGRYQAHQRPVGLLPHPPPNFGQGVGRFAPGQHFLQFRSRVLRRLPRQHPVGGQKAHHPIHGFCDVGPEIDLRKPAVPCLPLRPGEVEPPFHPVGQHAYLGGLVKGVPQQLIQVLVQGLVGGFGFDEGLRGAFFIQQGHVNHPRRAPRPDLPPPLQVAVNVPTEKLQNRAGHLVLHGGLIFRHRRPLERRDKLGEFFPFGAWHRSPCSHMFPGRPPDTKQ